MSKESIKTLKEKSTDLAGTTEIQKIGGILQEMLIACYEDTRGRSKTLIIIAVVLEIVALGVFAISAYSAWNTWKIETNPLIAAIAFQIVALVVFKLYGNAAKQLSPLHVCLERTNRFLLANAMAANLSGQQQTDKRGEIISAVVTAPILSPAVLERGS